MKKHKKRISLFLAAAFMVLLLPIGAIQVKAGGGSGVAIDPSSLELTLGGEDAEKTLTATVTDIDGKTVSDVEWSIDEDDGVVELSSPATGETVTVTALKAGTAKIIATVTPDVGEAQTAECMVTVNPAPIPVTGVSLNKTTLSLVEGADETLTATVDPANADDVTVSWSSSNTSVATVDENGKVTAVSAGEATITVKSNADETKTATCTVTVTIPVTSVSLNKNTLTLVVGNVDETLEATVAPSNATNKAVTWSSSNTAVATVDENGKVTAVGAGGAIITVTSDADETKKQLVMLP